MGSISVNSNQPKFEQIKEQTCGEKTQNENWQTNKNLNPKAGSEVEQNLQHADDTLFV